MRQIKHRPHYTVEDYDRWEGNWELIDGMPYAMSPSPSARHQFLGMEIGSEVLIALKKDGCRECKVAYELDWKISEDVVLCPDIVVLCYMPEMHLTKPPILIVEIISPSTALKDRQVKFEIYQEQGVPYYIIVDPKSKTQNIFVLVDGTYQERNTMTDFMIHEGCTISLDIQAVLGRLDA